MPVLSTRAQSSSSNKTVIGLTVGFGLLMIILGLSWIFWLYKRMNGNRKGPSFTPNVVSGCQSHISYKSPYRWTPPHRNDDSQEGNARNLHNSPSLRYRESSSTDGTEDGAAGRFGRGRRVPPRKFHGFSRPRAPPFPTKERYFRQFPAAPSSIRRPRRPRPPPREPETRPEPLTPRSMFGEDFNQDERMPEEIQIQEVQGEEIASSEVIDDGQDAPVSADAHRSDCEEPPPAFEDERSNTSPAHSDMEDQREIGEPEPDMEDGGEIEEPEPDIEERGKIEEPEPEFEREHSLQAQLETRPPSPEAPSNPRAPESVVLGSINPSATLSQKMLFRQSSWYGHSQGRSTVAALSNAGDRPVSLIRSMSSRSFDQPSRNRIAPVTMSDIVYLGRTPSDSGAARQHHNIEGLTSHMRFEPPVPMMAEYLRGMPRHVGNGEIDEIEISDVGTHQN